jgi:hypothetical protein
MFKYLVLNHIPRCGGSSLKKSIYDGIKDNVYFQQAPAYISEHTHSNICLYEKPHLIEAIHTDTLLFVDHSPTFFIENSFKLPIEDTYRILTLRNPISRIISHIHFFYNIHINNIAEDVLINYLEQFGNLTIDYLTKCKFLDISLEQKYKEAKKIINDYQFCFQVEKQKLCEIFNSSNPFELHIPNYHINRSTIDNIIEIEISPKIKNIIYSTIKLEIKLLEKYYEMDL